MGTNIKLLMTSVPLHTSTKEGGQAPFQVYQVYQLPVASWPWAPAYSWNCPG